MMKNALFGGVNAAAATAFHPDLSVDIDATATHCKWLLANGSNNLAVLGTTGETNSLGMEERKKLLEGLVADGVPVSALLPGTSAPNVPDAISLTRHAERIGCRGALLLPPFYYKNPSEDGLYAFYDEVIQGVGGDIKIYFYHFPAQSAVPITVSLIARLLKKYPEKIKGIKDSTGALENTKDYIRNFSADGFEVYTGADAGLQEILNAGGAGCITATSNIVCPLAAKIYAAPDSAAATETQALVARIRKAVAMAATIPAVKTLMAHLSGNAGWENVRPPHTKLPSETSKALIAAFEACNAPRLKLA